MANYEIKSNEDVASWFITRTCQLIPKTDIVYDRMHRMLMSSKTVPTVYAIHCGSMAEFYIKPLNSCVGDVDELTCMANQMIVGDGVPVLPNELSGLIDKIECYQIESHRGYPGFVRLRFLGELNYDWKNKQYESKCRPTANTGIYIFLDLASQCLPGFVVCGPASKSQFLHPNFRLEMDSVTSYFCPQWPREARNWPNRPRNHGWPTFELISEVVQNGCHVVSAQHRSCRDDKFQFRLSFSFAEVILLQSWTQTQQIVYHLLRYFVKSELVPTDCPKEDEVLCTYHLKTMMLWVCEDTPSEWWNASSVIAICSELLKKLLRGLEWKRCPNYFIPEANLFYEPSNSTILEKTKCRINEFCNYSILYHWFIENYILPVIQTHLKVEVAQALTPRLMEYMIKLLKYRKALVLNSLDFTFSKRFKHVHRNCRSVVNIKSPSGYLAFPKPSYNTTNVKSQRRITRFGIMPVLENELCFTYFDNLLFVLHFVHSLNSGEITLDSFLFVEIINIIAMQFKVVRSRYHNFPKTSTAEGSRFQFLRALDVMHNLTGSNSRSEFQLISLMSKEYLRRALQCEDSQINGVAPVALAYLAALHFASSEYQQALYFCSAVLVDWAPEEDKETLNAGCLLFIDDIARIVGLSVLHKKIIEKNLHYFCRRLYLDLRLSPDVFAHYLSVLSGERISKLLEFYNDMPDSAYSVDDCLKALLKLKLTVSMKPSKQLNTERQIDYRRAHSFTDPEAANLNPLMVRDAVIDALEEIALENMTSFYNVIRKDFGIQCNTADCYRALYLYKRRLYNELLNLCEQILLAPDLRSDLRTFSYENVLVLPPLAYFFDGDIQSLLGFRTLLCYLSRLNTDLKRFEDTFDWTFNHWFQKYSMYYLYPHPRPFDVSFESIRYHYYLGRHFLARYLKVRCCIDCNLPFKKALTEFAAQKNTFSFEHIICRFLQQQLGFNKKNLSTVSVSLYQ